MHSSLTFSISHQPPAPQARPGLLGRRGRCGSRALGSSAGFVPTAGRPGLAPVRREDAPVPQRPRCSPRPPLPGFPLYGWSGLEAAQGTAKPKASLSSQGLQGGFLEEGAPEQRPEEGLSQAREGGKHLPGRGDRVRQQQGVTPGLPGSWSRAQERRPEWLAGRPPQPCWALAVPQVTGDIYILERSSTYTLEPGGRGGGRPQGACRWLSPQSLELGGWENLSILREHNPRSCPFLGVSLGEKAVIGPKGLGSFAPVLAGWFPRWFTHQRPA